MPSYVRGDKASWTARGDFLFGAPMAGAEVTLRVTRAETYFRPEFSPDCPARLLSMSFSDTSQNLCVFIGP